MHTKEERKVASKVIELYYMYDIGYFEHHDANGTVMPTGEELKAAINVILSDIDEWREIEATSRNREEAQEAGFQVYSWMDFLREYTTIFIRSTGY